MSYMEPAAGDRSLAQSFGFQFDRSSDGWRWTAFDALDRVSDSGLAHSKAEAAACVIRALARG